MLTSRAVTILPGTTRVNLLDGIDLDRGLEVVLSHIQGPSPVIGDVTVVAGNGFRVVGTEFRLTLHGDTIYAVNSLDDPNADPAGNTVKLEVLIVGQK